MKPYDFVHLVLSALGGEIQGKTKLQKTIFFIGELTDNLDCLGFRPHYYGPYSDEITYALERLKALNFLSQNNMSAGYQDTRGFEISRQDFALTDEGKEIAEKKAQKYPEEWNKIKEAVARLQQAGDLDYMKMSIAAKTYYLLNKRRSATVKELERKAKEFGWNPTTAEINESVEFLRKINLVKK